MPEYICTMGPSINSLEKILELYNLGLRTIRFNMSHIDYDIFAIMEMIRQVEAITGGRIETLIDTRGPEVRIEIPEARQVEKDEILVLGKDFGLTVPYADILAVGDVLQVDDGKLSFVIVKKEGDLLSCLSLDAGKLKNKAGVHSDKLLKSIPFMSEKDLNDIRIAFAHDFDWLALSYVSSKEDLLPILAIKSEYPNSRTKIMAKVETQEAVNNLDEIIALSDGIMIARGDLGVYFPVHMIAALQDYISEKVLVSGKKLVVGTGFLRSMKTRSIPERAEVVDLYHTFLTNTTTIMFSGETAIADDPSSILKMANAIYESIETKPEMKR